ncbi:MAG: cobalt-precorrin-5B (C(1))-methyltransferase CbiD [Planctomycetota bacterium]
MTELREGYTTGTCAAAAARAAVLRLCRGEEPGSVEVALPGGETAELPVKSVSAERDTARAAVEKDAGDDPDITDGVQVVVEAEKSGDSKLDFRAGEGVGVVCREGLQVSPGEPAINPVPRRMIADAVRDITEDGLELTVSIPGGEELAQETFNPRVGVEGGLSVLGTTGRVRPFSCPALRQSITCLLDAAEADGHSRPVLVPGHVGSRAAEKHLSAPEAAVIEVSNEWGHALDRAAERSFRGLMVAGHPGKLAKLAAGDWNTHSSRSGSAVPVVRQLAGEAASGAPADCGTTEELFSSLSPADRKTAGNRTAQAVRDVVRERTNRRMEIAVFLTDMQGEVLGSAGDVETWKT